MFYAVTFIAIMIAAAAPAVAQSCATLGDQLDCNRAPARAAAVSPSPERKFELDGSAETTVSNHGTSTTLNNRAIDTHGIVELEFRASKSKCGTSASAYRADCD
jgi:hypothetical protein